MLTHEIFLFFLSNANGQCYYVDKNGLVNTCQPGDEKSWLPQAPDGWLQQQIGFGRNMKYWGLFRSYTQPLKFVGNGAKIIRYLLYTRRGVEEQVFLNVNKFNPLTDVYESYYKGELDLMNNVDDNPLESVSVNVMEGGLLKLIKAYENTTFEIPCDGSIPENISVNINGLKFHAIFDYSVIPTNIRANGVIVPIAFLYKQGNDANIISGDQSLQAFDPSNGGDFAALLNTSSNGFFLSGRDIQNFNIKTQFKFSGSLTNACVVIYTSLGTAYPIINTIDGNRSPSGAISGSSVYNIDFTINTVHAGERLFLMLITSDNTGSMSFGFTNNEIQYTFDSQFTDSTTYAIKPYDLLRLLLKKACEQAYTYPNTKVYNVQSDLLNQHANLVVTSGAALRKETNAVIKTSLSEFYDAFNAELCASMGNESTTAAPGEILYFEKKTYAFDPTNVTIDVGEVSKLKIRPATELFFDVLKIGYHEQKYDEKQGNNEWNTTAVYKAPIKKVNKELQLVSPYRADAYGIEYTRILVPATSNTANNKSDNDTFLLNIDYSKVQNAQAYTNGTQGPYYGSGWFLPDAGSGTNRGLLMQFLNITGSGIANNFSIVTRQSASDTLQYNGNNNTLNLTLALQISFNSASSIHYFNNTNVFGRVRKRKEALAAGIYYALFILYYNGNAIYTQDLTLISGTPTPININKQFTNFQIKFGDNFTYEIFYSSQTPYIYGATAQGTDADGYLLAFDVKSSTLTIADNSVSPVYGVTKKAYQSSNLANVSDAYNIEDLRITQMLQKHGSYFKGVLVNQLDKKFVFQTASKNKNLSTTLNGVTISEGSDIVLSTLPDTPMFYPYYIEFTTKVPFTFLKLFTGAANGYVSFTYCGVQFYGFPMDVKVKPALEDAQDWKLLCAPTVDLNTLVNIEYNGINNIELMAYGTAIPHLSPVQFVPLGQMQPAAYNFIHLDQDWFIKQVGFWPFKEDYQQKWQTNDLIQLQCVTNGLAPVIVNVIDCNGRQVDTFNFSQKTDPAVKSPLILWQASYSPADLAEGVYYFVLTAGTGGTTTVHISEPQYIASYHDTTILFEYSSPYNRQATVFTTGFAPSFRVEGWIDEYTPQARFATYEDQPANIELLNAIPYMTANLNIGTKGGVPPWVIRLADRIMLLKNVNIDGKGFTRDADAKWDKIDIQGWPKKYWKMQIRESQNSDVKTLTTTGQLNSNLTVAYNIETGAFGDGSGNNNVVQVTKVGG